ncbi:MAG: hypothetical protein R2712_28180 [Vicinamibacterales bacterium]
MALVFVLMMALQAAPDPVLAGLTGRWEGDGMVLGQPSRLVLDWSWTLDGQFLALDFRNDMGAGADQRRFEARAFYRPTDGGGYRGTWVDNTGAIRPIEGRNDGGALVARWGTPDTEVGETTYRVLDDGRLEVVDRVRQADGRWRTFGRSVLRKP